jgi:hypothetical protein
MQKDISLILSHLRKTAQIIFRLPPPFLTAFCINNCYNFLRRNRFPPNQSSTPAPPIYEGIMISSSVPAVPWFCGPWSCRQFCSLFFDILIWKKRSQQVGMSRPHKSRYVRVGPDRFARFPDSSGPTGTLGESPGPKLKFPAPRKSPLQVRMRSTASHTFSPLRRFDCHPVFHLPSPNATSQPEPTRLSPSQTESNRLNEHMPSHSRSHRISSFCLPHSSFHHLLLSPVFRTQEFSGVRF